MTGNTGKTATDYFGTSADVSGNTLIVGAPLSPSFAAPPGASGYAEVYTRPDAASAFTFSLMIEADIFDDFFGWSVAIESSVIAIAAPLDSTGITYVYDDSGSGLPVATLSDGINGFGYNVDIDSGVLAVGDFSDSVRSYDVSLGGATVITTDIHSDFENLDNSVGSTPIATSLGTIVSGARLEDQQGSDAGAVYVFDVAVPEVANKIIDQSVAAEPGDLFGYDLAISGDVMVVGAPEDMGFAGTTGDLGNGDRGEIHIFNRVAGDWVYNRTIDGPAGPAGNINDAFGRSIDISGDWIIVGAPRTNDPGDTTGRVHFIDTANADAIQTIAPPSAPDININFGVRVAIDGNTAAVGATTWGTTDGGQVLIYELALGTWTLVEQYNASGGYRLGRGIDIEGDRLAFGTLNNAGGGFVVIADRVGGVWPTQTDPFNTTDPQPNFEMVFNNSSGSQFGLDIALDGDNMLIGAPNESGIGLVEYLTFDGSTWNLAQTITPTTALAYESFGFSVDLDGPVAVIGARRTDTAAGSEAGAAFVFKPLGRHLHPS